MKADQKKKISSSLKKKIERIKLMKQQKKEEQERIVKEEKKKESNKATGLDAKNLKERINEAVREYGKDQMQEVISEFKTEIQRLREKKTLYRAEFLDLSMQDVVKRGIKNIGKEGYRFCFENDGRVYFQREVGAGK